MPSLIDKSRIRNLWVKIGGETNDQITGKKVRGKMAALSKKLERNEMLDRPHTFFQVKRLANLNISILSNVSGFCNYWL